MTKKFLKLLRYELLPALYELKINGMSPDIVVENGGLLVKAKNKSGKELAFFINEKQIKDGTYKAAFRPNLDKLLECLGA